MNKLKFDNFFMEEALDQAFIGQEQGEVPVGAVITYRSSKEIISKAHNLIEKEKNPLLHAEIIAINEALSKTKSKFLYDCDIYVSLEPCSMCAAAISLARLGRLFYSASDFKQGAVENGVRYFTKSSCFHRPEVYPGIACEISSPLMKTFFRNVRKNSL